jgi:lipoprotein-anchoring transpeptidase ErfK/SrfK
VSRQHARTPVVGNDFVPSQPRLQLAMAAPLAASGASVMVLPVHHVAAAPQIVPVYGSPAHEVELTPAQQLQELFHRNTLLVFALLILAIAALGIEVGSHYWSARLASRTATVPAAKAPTIPGLNLRVPTSELPARIQAITNQSATLTVGSDAKPLSPDIIKSWLQITPGNTASEQYIHIKAGAIAKSLTDLAAKYNKDPVNQVTVTHDGVNQVVVPGRNGAKLSDPATLATQASAAAKTVLDAKGLQFSTPLQTAPFQAVTPAAFNKLIEVNVVSKQMWLYDNGQLTHNYLVSAGAPATPTPIGEFHIFAKFASQDMKGFNVNGTPYFQPHVHWINYFLPGGYAVHGVYWHGEGWFGNINSSHGCVGLPDYQAEDVYNWAPIGTTVITHY